MLSTWLVEATVESHFLGTGTAPVGGAPAHPHWSLQRGGSGLIGPTWSSCAGNGWGLEQLRWQVRVNPHPFPVTPPPLCVSPLDS